MLAALINLRLGGPARLADAALKFPSLRKVMADRVRPLLSPALHSVDVTLVASDGPTAWEQDAREYTRRSWQTLGKLLKLAVPSAPAPLACAYQHCTVTDGSCRFYAFHAECARLCVVLIRATLTRAASGSPRTRCIAANARSCASSRGRRCRWPASDPRSQSPSIVRTAICVHLVQSCPTVDYG